MIISHKHQFIFIKTRKTAGTSIEIALAPYCSEMDVLTPIYAGDTKKYHYQARNHQGFINHSSAISVKENVPENCWSQYFKFTVERNPWDKMVSMYWWLKHKESLTLSFDEFCRVSFQTRRGFIPPSDYQNYTIDDHLVVDYVCRYENLETDFKYVCQQIGIPDDVVLPRAKSEYRTDPRPYQEYYNKVSRAMVAAHFQKEIELYHYEFE